jgi:DNA-binding NarL/FixJ family response regulator
VRYRNDGLKRNAYPDLSHIFFARLMDSPDNSSSVLVRILLVEDFEPFRMKVRSLIKERAEFMVLGEVSDGSAAVQKADELRPDLILMDVGLPSINGIEAARQILRSNPQSRILFLTQESSSDVVSEAFDLGARGYIVKMDARQDMLLGIDAVMRGEKFVSASLKTLGFPRFTDA